MEHRTTFKYMVLRFNYKLAIKFILLVFLILIVFGPDFVLSQNVTQNKCEGECNSNNDCPPTSRPYCACDPDSTDNKKEGICVIQNPQETVIICPPTKYTKIECLVESVSNWIFYIGLILAPLMFVLAGGYFITAAGNENKVKTGKSIATWTIVGLVVILMVKAFISVIRFVLGA